MRVLHVYAHPLEESFHAAIRDAAVEGMRAGGHAVDLLDLYAEGFDPVLRADHRRIYHDEAAIYGTVAEYVDRLRRAEALVLSFPTWCYGPPAMLKWFFDRVFVPGVSFTLENGVARPALTNIRRIVGISTYGRPRWTALMMGDPPRKIVTRYLRMLTAGKARTAYHALYDMNRADDSRRQVFLGTVRERMRRL